MVWKTCLLEEVVPLVLELEQLPQIRTLELGRLGCCSRWEQWMGVWSTLEEDKRQVELRWKLVLKQLLCLMNSFQRAPESFPLLRTFLTLLALLLASSLECRPALVVFATSTLKTTSLSFLLVVELCCVVLLVSSLLCFCVLLCSEDLFELLSFSHSLS